MDMTARPVAAVFTPDAVAAINRAYAEACDIVDGEGSKRELRLKLADHMMYLARAGETDAARLCSLSVLKVLGRQPSTGRSPAHNRVG